MENEWQPDGEEDPSDRGEDGELVWKINQFLVENDFLKGVDWAAEQKDKELISL